MPEGTIQVLLVGAKGLESTDFLTNNDPYVLLACRTQEQKSSVASGQGSEPEWNETFIMDRDTLTDDDYLGKASIPLEPLFIEGNLPATAYSVVKDEEYRGEIRVGLSFTPEDRTSRALDAEEEGYGGWKESAYTD
ncbi:hypothetical protein OIU84_012704 [Salix udensis]|uniref:C2 domain-containing protein n=1 Tax=Salix udensis TaxID=889485 RepID=A0AAD6JGC2_9ROSI|nr:hypothetical protein OIU84_012704 [Salix udensis]